MEVQVQASHRQTSNFETAAAPGEQKTSSGFSTLRTPFLQHSITKKKRVVMLAKIALTLDLRLHQKAAYRIKPNTKTF